MKTNMKRVFTHNVPVVVVLVVSAAFLFIGGSVAASAWVDELSNSIVFYKATYPTTNFAPYEQKLSTVRDAVGKGDKAVVRKEMGAWLQMLRARAHGIHDVAADELFNFSLMVAPIEEYGISVPQGSPTIPGLP